VQIDDQINKDELKCGDVFKWIDFPYQNDGKIKDRWFIYLGRMDITSSPLFYYMQTTTTQIGDFDNGNRVDHKTVLLKATETPFQLNCLMDVSIPLLKFTSELILSVEDKCIYKGHLPENKKREILKKIEKTISKVQYRDIRESFRRDGLSL
jgi:hypothetical protein